MRRVDIVRAGQTLLKCYAEAGLNQDHLAKYGFPTDTILNEFEIYIRKAVFSLALKLQTMDAATARVRDLFFVPLWTPEVLIGAAGNEGLRKITVHLWWSFRALTGMLSLLREGDRPDLTEGFSEEEKYLKIVLYHPHERVQLARFDSILKAIQKMYAALCQFEMIPFEPLEVVSLDSGSRMELVLKGIDKVLKTFKRNYDAFLERTLFFEERRTELRLENIAKSLPIYEEIKEKVQSGAIPEKLAEKIVGAVAESTLECFQGSVILPEHEGRQAKPLVELLGAAQKLLPENTDKSKLLPPSPSGIPTQGSEAAAAPASATGEGE